MQTALFCYPKRNEWLTNNCDYNIYSFLNFVTMRSNTFSGNIFAKILQSKNSHFFTHFNEPFHAQFSNLQKHSGNRRETLLWMIRYKTLTFDVNVGLLLSPIFCFQIKYFNYQISVIMTRKGTDDISFNSIILSATFWQKYS